MIFKGNTTSDTITIYTGIGHGDCGMSLEIGKNYIFYLYFCGKELGKGIPTYYFTNQLEYKLDRLSTDICTRTQLFNLNEIGLIIKYCQ